MMMLNYYQRNHQYRIELELCDFQFKIFQPFSIATDLTTFLLYCFAHIYVYILNCYFSTFYYPLQSQQKRKRRKIKFYASQHVPFQLTSAMRKFSLHLAISYLWYRFFKIILCSHVLGRSQLVQIGLWSPQMMEKSITTMPIRRYKLILVNASLLFR